MKWLFHYNECFQTLLCVPQKNKQTKNKQANKNKNKTKKKANKQTKTYRHNGDDLFVFDLISYNYVMLLIQYTT